MCQQLLDIIFYKFTEVGPFIITVKDDNIYEIFTWWDWNNITIIIVV